MGSSYLNLGESEREMLVEALILTCTFNDTQKVFPSFHSKNKNKTFLLKKTELSLVLHENFTNLRSTLLKNLKLTGKIKCELSYLNPF